MKKLIFVILAAAFILRVVGLGYGLPMLFVGDEASLVGGALKMLELRSFIPALHPEEFRLLYYPPLIPYLYLLVIVPVLVVKFFLLHGNLDLLRQMIVLDPTPVWLASRFAAAVFGTGLVFLTYLIGRKIFGQLAGVFAASFVATSFLAVQLSHFARHWVPATFFTYLVIAFGLLIYLQAGRKAYSWAGYAAGVAFGASFISAIGLVVPIVAHLLVWGKRAFAKEHLNNLALLGLLFMLIGGVMAVLNYPEFHRIVFGEDSSVGGVKSLLGLLAALWGSALAFFKYEPLLVIFGLLGLGVLATTSRKLLVLFTSFPVAYWVVLYFFFHFEPRYNMILVPWFALLAAVAAVQLWNLPLHQTVQRAALAILLLLPAAVSGYYDYLLLQPDTRQVARAWIEQHIPAQTSIALYAGTLDLVPARQAVHERAQRYAYTIRTRDRVLLQFQPQSYPVPAYNVLNIRELREADQRALQARGLEQFAYLVIERFAHEQLPPFVAQLQARGKVMASFSASNKADVNGNFDQLILELFTWRNLGPEVVIVQL